MHQWRGSAGVRNCRFRLRERSRGENSRLASVSIGSADFPDLVFYAFEIIIIIIYLY